MDWVMVHAEIHQPDPCPAPMTHYEGRCVRTGLAVEGQPVEFHIGCVWDVAVGQNRPLLQDNSEIVINTRSPRLLGMDDEQADHAHHLLHCTVRVVKESSGLVQR